MQHAHENPNELAVKIANHISAMLAYWDKDMVCRFANSAYSSWFGKSPEEMIDKMTIVELLGPLYQKNRQYIEGALSGEPQTFEREIPLPSGGTKHSLANYYPNIVNGRVEGFFVHVADVHELKLMEMELRSSNETIAAQNERLRSFSNIVSHNLKSYSNNFSSLLDLYTGSHSETDREKIITVLNGLTKQFRSTIDQLTLIGKSHNLKEITLQSVSLHEAIESVIRILQFQIAETKAVVKNNVPLTTNINANAALLESILLNLLTNAIKYRRETTVPLITFDSRSENGEVILDITDNGKGIDLQKYGNKLFGIYNTFHGNADAEGVGLYLTKNHILAIGGKIHVESEVGVGTKFTITFRQGAD